MNKAMEKFKRRLHQHQIKSVLKYLEEAFDRCNTLEEWESEAYSIYMTHCSFSYDTFLRLKKYAGV